MTEEEFLAEYLYRTQVTAHPTWQHPMGQHLDSRSVKWAWNVWSANSEGVYGEVCFANEQDQLIFNLACGEWTR